MSEPPTPESHSAPAPSIDDLSELLGHVHNSWDNERRALARQMHDSIGSSLTALTMHLSLLTQKLPQDKAVTDRAAQMKQSLMKLIETNRDMQLKLWNDKLEFLGVTVALSELASQFGGQHGLTVRCSLPEDELSCPREFGVVLLRTAEEALRNVATHAQASEVDLILDDNDEEVMLTIKDNGIGPAAATAAAGDFSKHGLRTLRARVGHLNGNLSLTAGAQGGSALTITLPRAA